MEFLVLPDCGRGLVSGVWVRWGPPWFSSCVFSWLEEDVPQEDWTAPDACPAPGIDTQDVTQKQMCCSVEKKRCVNVSLNQSTQE